MTMINAFNTMYGMQDAHSGKYASLGVNSADLGHIHHCITQMQPHSFTRT